MIFKYYNVFFCILSFELASSLLQHNDDQVHLVAVIPELQNLCHREH